ncbi:MFS monocarboxylate transporter [Amylocarpus encephaloides]|uniref:MFS monocarboxylate transporter n=1 Tax=Amylocarpus encephaloides TaxID=45428 RepID=A0A9P8C1G8_9HELO|nr:MFS monocarboxylate transporter [Amylocarpus encephaloides]
MSGDILLAASHPTSAPHNSHKLHDPDTAPLEAATTSRSRADYNFPEGGTRAWLVIFGSFSIICGTFGLISSVGLFQSYWQTHQLAHYTSRDVGWIAAVNVFLNLFLGVQIGPLFDRYGPRYLVLIGSVVYVASLLILAQCKLYWHFMLVYGVLTGTSSAFLTTTALAVVAHWFERKRGMASGIAFVGSSVGGIIFPMVLKSTLSRLSWAWSVRVVALIVGVLLVVGNTTVKGRLPPRKNGGAVDLRCFLDARFSWATLGVACFEFVLFGALGLLPTYALFQGFSSQTAFNSIATLNAGSALGRCFSGYMSDRVGRFNTMLFTLIWTLLAVLVLWLPLGHNVYAFYAFAPMFGFGSGSIVSMAPVCIGQLCKADEYGQFYGTSYSVVAFATLICIPMGGELLPTIGATSFVGFFAGILVLSLWSFLVARWACLEWKWKWNVKV